MGTVAQSSSKMQGLLVLASLTVASAQVLPLGYHGLGLGYGGLVHPYAASIVKPVIKEIEVPVETIKFVAAETGCTNSFGHAVPCARKKRQADEAVAVEAEAALPAPTVTEVEVPQYKFVPKEKVVELQPA